MVVANMMRELYCIMDVGRKNNWKECNQREERHL